MKNDNPNNITPQKQIEVVADLFAEGVVRLLRQGRPDRTSNSSSETQANATNDPCTTQRDNSEDSSDVRPESHPP